MTRHDWNTRYKTRRLQLHVNNNQLIESVNDFTDVINIHPIANILQDAYNWQDPKSHPWIERFWHCHTIVIFEKEKMTEIYKT